MPKCSYCGKMYHFPYGVTLVANDGVIKYICSSKCRKNMAMKRRKVRWVRKSKEGSEYSEIKEMEEKAEEKKK